MKIMEVCGTHTAAIFKAGIRSLISDKIKLISGPGCPVCVTPMDFIDKCIGAAMCEASVVYSFGDMLKVPGNEMSLSEARSHGARVELMYSPFEVLKKAEENPKVEHIIAAVGFETTIPIYALLVQEAKRREIKNLKLVTSLRSAIPAIDWVASNEEDIDAFLCPGHVSVVIGEEPYNNLALTYNKPFVIAGFEAEHILLGIDACVRNKGVARVDNFYAEAVHKEGNKKAREAIAEVFTSSDVAWRGLGVISGSGFFLRKKYEEYNYISDVEIKEEKLPDGCKCADVIRGRIEPVECPLFEKSCTPQTPVGPCMVSSEGVCGIWYQNR